MVAQEFMRRYLDQITAGDFEGAAAHYADGLVAHVTGEAPGAGVYEGKAAFAGYLAQMMEMLDSIQIDEHDLLTSDDHAVVLSTMTATRGGSSFSTNRVAVYHVEDDQITEIWMVDADQKGVADFMS